MGTVIQLKKQINNSYFDLKNSVEEKLILVEEKIKNKLSSEVDLVQKISDYHAESGGKRLRALLALQSSKLCGYLKGGRDINLAACVELIHSATLLHDDVIDESKVRRGIKTTNSILSPLATTAGVKPLALLPFKYPIPVGIITSSLVSTSRNSRVC